MNVLQPFLSFACEFQNDKAYNMFAFMFDPFHKIITMHHGTFKQWSNQECCHQIWQGHDSIIHEGQQILESYQWQQTTKIIDFSINYFFDASTSTKEANETLFVCELSIFHHVIVWEEEFVKPLTRWKDHANRFPTITFVAKQIDE